MKKIYLILFSSSFFVNCSQHQTIRIVTTTADMSAVMQESYIAKTNLKVESNRVVELYPDSLCQQLYGIGCTYSEASAYNLAKMSQPLRDEIIKAYFAPEGANMSIVRTVINSCDASSEYYSYNEVLNDTMMTHFSIQKDIDNNMIPGLKKILLCNPRIKIFASPWTPPLWMKSSNKFNCGYLEPRFYKAWARYLRKYVVEYQNQGVDIWGITPQNEPMAYCQKWDACGWKASEMANFMGNYLIPEFNENGLENIEIIGFDHNKWAMNPWIDALMQHSRIRDRMKFVAHHWYDGGEGKYYDPNHELLAKYPNFKIIASEQGVFGLYLNQPDPAELYAADIIGNFNHMTNSWILWGMVFDVEGKPNHGDNFNHTPIMVDTQNQKVIYNQSYYYITHISRYIDANTFVVAHQNRTPYDILSYRNNKQLIVILLNRTDESSTTIIKVKNQEFPVKIPAHSISTLLF